MNTYSKYAPNVFLAKCEEEYEKGEIVTLTSKRGRETEVEIYNLVFEKDDFYYYSYVRVDGYNARVKASNKASRYQQWARSAENTSEKYFEASNEGREFLSLGEPIKVGHHSEKRHRSLIQRNRNRMDKGMGAMKKAEEHKDKASYWESRTNEINLSMPESVEYYASLLEDAITYHKKMKSGEIERPHSLALSYANKRVKDLQKKSELAKKLWA